NAYDEAPLTRNCSEYDAPAAAAPRSALVKIEMLGLGPITLRFSVSRTTCDAASVKLMTALNGPGSSGVPLSVIVDGSNVMPAGRAPDTIVPEYGGVPPTRRIAAWNGTFSVACPEIAAGCPSGDTRIGNTSLTLTPSKSMKVTVVLNVPVAVGAP